MSGNAAAKAQLQVAAEQRRASREDLFSGKVRYDEPFIESLGATVKIKSLTGRERRVIYEKCGFNHMTQVADDPELMTRLTIMTCLVDPKVTEEDLEDLLDQDIQILDELSVRCTIHNLPAGAEGSDELEAGKDDSSPTPISDSDSS